MAFEAKMMYVSAEMECNYTLKQVFDSKISWIAKPTQNMSGKVSISK